jgi:hypothetical protein
MRKKTIAVIAALFAFATVPSEASPAQPGWRIDQTSTLIGPRRMLITPTAVKITDLNNELSVVTSAPDWKVYFINDHQKTFCETTAKDLDSARATKIFLEYKYDLGRKDWQTKPSKPVGGLKTVERTLKVDLNEKPQDGWIDLKHPQRGIREADYVEASTFKVPEPMSQVIGKSFFLPKVTGIPLSFYFISRSGVKKDALETTKVQACSFSADEFKVPTGYKRLALQRLVGSGNTAGAFLEDMSELYTPDEEKNSKRK